MSDYLTSQLFKIFASLVVQPDLTSLVIFQKKTGNKLLPSQQDQELLTQLQNTIHEHQVRLADYIIVNSKGYFSFREAGLLCDP